MKMFEEAKKLFKKNNHDYYEMFNEEGTTKFLICKNCDTMYWEAFNGVAGFTKNSNRNKILQEILSCEEQQIKNILE